MRMVKRALAGTVLGLALLSTNSGAARAQEEGWSPERDGFQVRLAIESPRPAYRDGDLIAFRLALRNTRGGREALRLRGIEAWTVGVGPGGVITLDPLPKEAELVDLGPGEVREFPGPRVRIDTRHMDGAGVAGVPFGKEPLTLPLMPGRYTVRCPLPFWVADADDPNRATALRAVPRSLELTVLASEASPVMFPAGPYEPSTAWGSPVNGLMAGLQLGSAKLGPGGVLRAEVRVRNLARQPITFSYPEYQEYDWSPMVVNEAGESVRVHSVFVSGLRHMKQVTLQPGELLVIGRPVLEITAQEPPEAGIHNPRLVARAGRYMVSYVIAVRPGNATGVHLTLATGQLPLEVVPAK